MNPLNVPCRMFLYANIVYLNMHICHVIYYAIVVWWCISLGHFGEVKKGSEKDIFPFLSLPLYLCIANKHVLLYYYLQTPKNPQPFCPVRQSRKE